MELVSCPTKSLPIAIDWVTCSSTFMQSSLIGFSRGEMTNECFHAVNPKNGQALPDLYVKASLDDVEKACRLAKKASLELGQLDGKRKSSFLIELAQQVESLEEEVVLTMSSETGLPEARVRAETMRTCGQLRMFAKLVAVGDWVDARIDRAQPNRKPLPKPDMRSMLRPIGPIAVFCASNFPLAFSVAGGDSASAWAAGCPVIVKAHHAHPGTALLIGQAVVRAIKKWGLPEGSFSLIFGDGKKVGRSLAQNSCIQAIGFTGSRSGGQALFDLANAREDPIPVFAEMSSVNPLFVFPGMSDQGIEEFSDGLTTSVTLGVGQFCTNPGIVFYPRGKIGNKFISSFSEKMKAFVPSPMLHEGIRKAYCEGFDDLASSSEVEIIYKKEPSEAVGVHAGAGILATTIEFFKRKTSLWNEVFGPSTLLVSYQEVDELLEIAKDMDGQLTASLFGNSSDLDSYSDLVLCLETKVGRLLFNEFPTGVEVCRSIVHGGPFPATTDGRSTSVGEGAILRFARPVCYQGFPDDLLPMELREDNPLGLKRSEN